MPPSPVPRRGLYVLAALGMLAGCNGGGDGDDTAPAETLRVETQQVTSNGRGILEVDFEVQEGERFQVVQSGDRNNGVYFTEELIDPDGNTVLTWEDWTGSEYSLTSAVYGAEFANTLNWPVREEDGPVAAGVWTLVGDTLDASYRQEADQDVEVTIFYRKDLAEDVGTVHSIIAYCEGVREDEEVVLGVEAAVAYWTELYASWGITLTTEYADIAVDPSLPDTYLGVDEYKELLEQQVDYPLLMVIGEEIAGDAYIYGEAGGIPGPMLATEISAVELSWLAHAGQNGKFSDEEVLLMGETMAHETGHFLGLFHPAEYPNWDYWDALDDTEECTSYSDCEDDLGDNLMFPYPVCTSIVDCLRQDRLSDQQVGILQRYVGVD